MEKQERKTRVVPKNLPWGVLVWQNADGTALSDSEGNVLSMDCFKGDLEALRKMRVAATHYGSGDGRPAFLPGSRKISQMEWESQMEQFINGDPIEGDIDA
jgi:phage portal protein BeeE